MSVISIAEMPSRHWELRPTFRLRIDRSDATVEEYLRDKGVAWHFGESHACDIRLYKEEVSRLTLWTIAKGAGARLSRAQHKHISLISEPRHLSPVAYVYAHPGNTLAVAPGNRLQRLFLASEWIDPMLDSWKKRKDAACWIARPTPERISLARAIIAAGVKLDIYSRAAWPLDAWKGYAENEVDVARTYKYKIVCENSAMHGYHSEKLFNSIRCGCVTIYIADPHLDLSYVKDAIVPYSEQAIRSLHDISAQALSGIERFMFTAAWEVYSFREFYARIIAVCRRTLSGNAKT